MALGVSYGSYNFKVKKGEIEECSWFPDYFLGKAKAAARPERSDAPKYPEQADKLYSDAGQLFKKSDFEGASNKLGDAADLLANAGFKKHKRYGEVMNLTRRTAEELAARAQASYKTADFEDAAKDLALVQEILIRTGDAQEKSKQFEDAFRFGSRCEAFALIASRKPPSPLVEMKEFYRLQLKGKPQPIYGALKELDSGGYMLYSLYSPAMISENRIESKTSVSEQEFKSMLLKELDNNIADAKSAVALYTRGVIFALNYKCTERITELFERVFGAADWEVVVDILLADENTKELKKKIDLGFNRTPTEVVFKDLRASGRIALPDGGPPKPRNVKPPDPVEPDDGGDAGSTPTPVSAGGSDFDKGEQKYREAMKYQASILPDDPNYAKNMKKALVILNEAQAYYKKALAGGNANRTDIEERLQEIQGTIRYIVHNMPIDLDD